jgi:rubrerythrin
VTWAELAGWASEGWERATHAPGTAYQCRDCGADIDGPGLCPACGERAYGRRFNDDGSPAGDGPDEPLAWLAPTGSQTCSDCRGSGNNAEAPGDCPSCGGWGTILR